MIKHIDIILFLNKKDILEEKIRRGSIRQYITKYQGSESDPKQVIAYIQNELFEKVTMACIEVRKLLFILINQTLMIRKTLSRYY